MKHLNIYSPITVTCYSVGCLICGLIIGMGVSQPIMFYGLVVASPILILAVYLSLRDEKEKQDG